MKILLSGCNGAMGRTMTNLITDKADVFIIAGVDKFSPADAAFPVYCAYDECEQEADIIIDFSHPSALKSLLKYAKSNKLPIVLSTTGYTDNQIDLIIEISNEIPIFMSSNMSQGINLMIELIKQASSFLKNFDIEIIEKHHHNKADAPSGTALMLAESINEVCNNKKEYVYGRHNSNKKRSNNEIGIHALRGGTIVGEHQVHFIGTDEVIEIRHSAKSKNIFAEGALKAAKFILSKKSGLYNMKSMM